VIASVETNYRRARRKLERQKKIEMSSDGDFGPLLDVLVTCVGAVDVISVLALICNSVNGSSSSSNDSPVDINNNDVKAFRGARDKSPLADDVKSARTKNASAHDDNAIKVDEPQVVVVDNDDDENGNDEDEDELEPPRSRENTMERFLDEERERFINTDRLRRSQSPTPDSFLEREEDESHEDDESHGENSQTASSSTRDDGDDSDGAIRVSQRESREKETSDTDDDRLIELIEEMPAEIPPADVNENFIRMEKMQNQTQSPKVLVKQAKVGSDDFPDESMSVLKQQQQLMQAIATESQTADSIMAHANVSSQPKIEKFPKASEILASADETVTELISTNEPLASTQVLNAEEHANARREPPVMVHNLARENELVLEQVSELPPPPQTVEIVNEPQSVIGSLMDVNVNPSINLETKSAAASTNSSTVNLLNVSNASLSSTVMENVCQKRWKKC
jgi:hypothetical protein